MITNETITDLLLSYKPKSTEELAEWLMIAARNLKDEEGKIKYFRLEKRAKKHSPSYLFERHKHINRKTQLHDPQRRVCADVRHQPVQRCVTMRRVCNRSSRMSESFMGGSIT